ncbi:DUF1684 domain-containing protein [Portibacter lacus]|uniref:DUF1684 domain-containing protein n=1 Tax=Portibacter lacus TaxID=1099794 RepID=A0AA37SQB0_9BACT|nr:DUF1684 domain-containing protein [Portibacter lacus]GLR17379.1 hypothetical protein GCM10007940_19940 [Portibacter lacus]
MKEISAILVGLILCFGALQGQGELAADYSKDLKKYRKDYKKALLSDERAPLADKKDIKKISFYEPNEAFIVKCLFIGASEARPFEMATFSGVTKPYIKYGELLFEVPGKGTHRISVYQSLKALKIPQYKDHLFVPFKDLTTGDTTYGGGRYIDIRLSDIEKGIVYLDFNKAYNPWCAYSDGFSCPIPPEENTLNIAIEAGELSFDDEEI